MKLLFLIATCERPFMLENLIRQIRAQCPHDFQICVIDDASEKDYSAVQKLLKEVDGWYYRQRVRHGKKNYWQTVDKLFQQANRYDFDYVFKLDDDVELHPQAIQKSVDILEQLCSYDSEKTVLNMWVDHRAEQSVWVNRKPKVVNIGSLKLRRVGWIDGGNWAASKRVLEVLNWACPQPPDKWWDRPGDSSGVGKYLSTELSRTACRIYMPMNSFVFHGGHDSVMHSEKNKMENRPIEMKKRPWL